MATIRTICWAAAALMLAAGLGACSHATPAQVEQAAAAKPLSGADIKSTLVGNTLSGISKKGPTYTETYLPDGTLRGIWAGSEKYHGTWEIKGDRFCVDYAGSDDSDGCNSLSLNGDQLYWVSDSGTVSNVDRPATVAQGNPNNL